MNSTAEKKRIYLLMAIVAALLLIPLIAMQFTTEVRWTPSDFALMGGLLFLSAIGIEVVLRVSGKPKNRIALIAIILMVLLLIWVELAVGVFGTPFAGT